MSSVNPDYASGGGGGVGGVGGGVDPDYVSGGGGDAGGVEKKVLAVIEREFSAAIHQVNMIKQMIVSLLCKLPKLSHWNYSSTLIQCNAAEW